MSSRESNKLGVALVTGASSGIGKAIAVRLAQPGCKTYGAARHPEKMTALAEAGGHPVVVDVSDAVSIQDCVSAILLESGGVDVLVNVAGTALYGSVEESALADARELFEINLFGAEALIQQLAPWMRARRSGSIINITSVGGVIASPYGAWYHATKFAFEGFSAALRQELSPFGVYVVIVRPEAIKTGWRAIAGSTLLANSGDGPYAKATRAMHAKYMSAQFEKAVADPIVVANVVQQTLSSERKKSVYMVPRMASVLLTMTALMGSDRIRDAFVRKFIGLPKSM
jgi:short-subunit dehydrogenase